MTPCIRHLTEAQATDQQSCSPLRSATKHLLSPRLRSGIATTLSMILAFEAMPAVPAAASPLGDFGTTISEVLGLGQNAETPAPDAEHVVVRFSPNVPEDTSETVRGQMGTHVLVLDGEERALPENEFSLDGHRFMGWSTTPDGKDDDILGIPAISIPDEQMLLGLDFDEEVTTMQKDGNDESPPVTQIVPHSLAEAMRDNSIMLYAQWQKRESPTKSDVTATVTRRKSLSAVTIEGNSDATVKQMTAAIEESGVAADEAIVMAEAVSRTNPVRNATRPDEMEHRKDDSEVNAVDLVWVTPDTVDNGQADLLYLKPGGELPNDLPQSVRMRVNWALSGEHDYGAGDINITFPATMFKDRDGNDIGRMSIPYPENPKTTDDFNWTLQADGTYLLTNTRPMDAATSGYIEFQIDQLVPHKIQDMSVSDDFWVHVEVVTHRGNLIGMTSSDIRAQIDTEEAVRSARKYSTDVEWATADKIPQSLRRDGVDEYVVVSWYMYSYISGNTEFTLQLDDIKTDAYDGFIIYPEQSVSQPSYANPNVYTGYIAGGSDGSALVTLGYQTVRVAYPANQFQPDTNYVFENKVTYTLTERDPAVGDDPQKVTTAEATAARPWSWHLPQFEQPTGHFMVNKIGNDGATGSNTSPYWAHPYQSYYSSWLDTSIHNRDDYYGIYPSALNDLQDGHDTEIAYTVESIGYILPWTYEGDYRVLENYGKRPVTMVTYDSDDTKATPMWLNGNVPLQLGTDYEYKAVEFPKAPSIGTAKALNLNPDGSIAFIHAGDGTVTYEPDYQVAHIPPVTLAAKVAGEWQDIAIANWSTGSLVLTTVNGGVVTGNRVMLPQGTEQIRTTVSSKNAYIWYYIRPIITVHDTGKVGEVAEQLFATSYTPQIDMYNSTYMRAYDDQNEMLVDIHKDAMDKLQGYSTDIAAIPSKGVTQTLADVDYDHRTVTLHYEAEVQEQSYIPDVSTYNKAVEDGRLVPETRGIWYDLLPKGMEPVLSTVRLRAADAVRDSYAIRNYRGTGRTLLVVEATLTPKPEQYRNEGDIRRYMDKPMIAFDATYPFDAIKDYGDTDLHNVIAFESLSRNPIGTVTNHGGEPDNPRSSNNIATSVAFANDTERDALTGLDTDHPGNRFVYAGVTKDLDILAAARTSLAKDLRVDNDDKGWSKGTYDDVRTVYEGGWYSYRLRMMSNANTTTKNLIIYDSLENFYAVDGNDPADMAENGAQRWRGSLVSIDTSQLVAKGVRPVVYYSTVDELMFAPNNASNDVNPSYMDLSNTAVWTPASQYGSDDLSNVRAIAIDCSQGADGNDFELLAMESITAIVNMHAPSGSLARTYIQQDAHAYNNIYLSALSIDDRIPGSGETNLIRNDYTKVGLKEHKLGVWKEWDDDGNRDGARPDEVTVHLYANGQDTGQSKVLDDGNGWHDEFTNIPYTNDMGEKIHYTVREDAVQGYTASVLRTAEGGFMITNRHEPEKVSISGNKTWVGGEGEIPSYIVVKLFADGTQVASTQVQPDATGEWTYQFTGLHKYRPTRQEIAYTVEESTSRRTWMSSVSGYDITNTYHPYGDLRLEKHVIGQTAAYADTRFRFRLELTDPSTGEFLPDEFDYVTSDGRTGKIGNGGTIDLKDGESVTVKEIPNGTEYRITEDERAGYSVTASENLSGAVIGNETQNASVTNTYHADGSIVLEAKKSLSGRDLKRYQFRAEIHDNTGALIRTGTNRVDTAHEGTFAFGALCYTEADVRTEPYVYTIKETTRTLGGYTYDSRVYTAYVTVSDNGDGTLATSVSYKNGDADVTLPLFENEYHASGSIQLQAWKQLNGRSLTDGEFTFKLADENGNQIGNLVTNDENGTIVFDAIPFNETHVGNTYRYIATEVTGGDTTVNYSAESYAYEVTVVDNGDGTLSFVQGTSAVTVGEPRALRWDEVSDEDKADYIWYNPSYTNIRFWCSFDRWGQINESSGRAPYIYHTSTAQNAAAAAISDALGVSVTASDLTTYYDGQSESAGRRFNGANVINRLAEPLSDVFPWFAGVLERLGASTFAQRYDIDFMNIDSVPSWYQSYLPDLVALHTETVDIDISDDDSAMPVFTNTLKPGSLKIEKHVAEVPAGHEADEFRFHVQLTGENLPETMEYEHTQLTGTGGTILAGDQLVSHEDGILGTLKGLYDKLTGLFKPTVAYADVVSWTQYTDNGSSIEWMIYDDGTLTIRPISGNRGILQYNSSETERNYAPWNSYLYSQIKSVDVPDNCTIEVRVSAYHMFYNARNLTSIDTAGFDMSNVTNMAYMFNTCESLQSLDLSVWRVPDLAIANYMFSGCSSLSELDLSNFNTSRVTNMSSMFSGCSGLTTLDVSSFDTSNVTNMYAMFTNCSSLTSLNLSNFDTSNVSGGDSFDGMGFMFESCSSLESLDISNFDISKLTSTRAMFQGCTSLVSLDVSSWDTSNVTNMGSTFTRCSQLASLDVSHFNTANVTNMGSIFAGCSSLTSLDVSRWDTSNVTNMSGMFSGCSSLTSLDVSHFDTSNVTAVDSMFRECSGVSSLDVSNFDMSNVRSMYSMFYKCSRLSSLDVSNFDTSNTTNMSYMFYECSGVSSLDVSNFDTSNVTTMSYMFYNCSELTSLDVSHFNTSKVTSLGSTFYSCSALTFIDISNWDTSNVTYMESLFRFCSSIASLDVSHFNTSKVTNMGYMFDSSSLDVIDISSFDFSSVKNTRLMFYNCANLTTIYVAPDTDLAPISILTNSTNMFGSDANLVGGNGTVFDVSHTDKSYARIDGLYDEPGYFTVIPQYTIQFDSGSGTGSMPSCISACIHDFLIPKSLFSRFGYVQTGWLASNGTTYDVGGIIPADTYSAGHTITLTAVWEPEDTNVTLNNGSFEVILKANEAAVFPNIPAGTAYQVYEETPSGWVLVSQSDTSGNIRPTETSTASFTNRYDEGHTSLSIVGRKLLDGRDAEQGTFAFEMRENGVLVTDPIYNVDGGGIVFPPIVYGEGDVGTHVYTITEIMCNDTNLIYDTHSETVTVTVTKNGQNLSATATYDDDGVVFSNTTLPGSIQITKEATGGGNPNQEFEFEVTLKNFVRDEVAPESSPENTNSMLGDLLNALSNLFAPQTAYADSDIVTWQDYTSFGSSIRWKIDSAGILVVAPVDGAKGILNYMPTNYHDDPHTPWEGHTGEITGVSVPDDATIVVPYAYRMFMGAQMSTVDLSGFDFSGCSYAPSMFEDCTNLTTFDLCDIDWTSLGSTSRMFKGCSALVDVNATGWVAPSLGDASEMFSGCGVTTLALDGIQLSRSDGCNMSGFIAGCSALEHVSIRNASLGAYSLTSFISGCPTLKTVTLDNTSFPRCASISGFIPNCPNVTSLSFLNVNLSNVSNTGQMVPASTGTDGFTADFSGAKFGTSLTNLFQQSNLTEVSFVGADTSRVTRTSNMFEYCHKLIKVDMHGLDLSSCVNSSVGWMFSNSCAEGYDINLQDVSFGDNLGFMFDHIGDLDNRYNTKSNYGVIDFRGSDMSRVSNMYAFLRYANAHVYMSNLDLSSGVNVYDFSSTFGYDSDDAVIDLSNTKLGTTCYGMFYQYDAKTLILTNVDTSSVTQMQQMFYGMNRVTELDLTSFDVSHVTDMTNMFCNCNALTTIYTKADADWSIDAPISSSAAPVFDSVPNLVGGNGTTFMSSERTPALARVDGLDGMMGYFTNGTGNTLVTFGTNGGTILVGDSHVIQRGAVRPVSVPRVVRNGFVLTDWNTKADGTGTSYGLCSAVTPELGATLVLYAQWTPVGEAYAYDVVHKLEKADAPGTYEIAGRETQYATATSGVTIRPNTYYGFSSPAARTTDIAADGSTVITFEYARRRFDVTMTLNDGTTRTQAFIGGIRQALDAAPTVDGKRFVGWFDGTSGENGFYADRQEVTFDAATTLYAQYVDASTTSATDGLDTTMRVKVKAGETVTIPNIPAGTEYEIREINIPSGWTQTGIIGETGEVSANTVSEVTVTNAYSTSGTFDLVAYKHLQGRAPVDGQFSFELVDPDGVVIQTVANGDVDTRETLPDSDTGEPVANPHYGQAPIAFRNITSPAPGTYTYKIREVRGNDTQVTYDTHEENITVQIIDNQNGTSHAVITYDNDGPIFNNEMKDGNLQLSKTIEDETPASKDATFTFDLELVDSEGTPIPDASYELVRQVAPTPAGVTGEGMTPTSNFVAEEGHVVVTYDANGGYYEGGYAKNLIGYEVTPTGVTPVDGEGEYADPLSPASDRSFGGWYLDADCTDGQEFQQSSLTANQSNQTVYAKWNETPEADQSTTLTQFTAGHATITISGGEKVWINGLPIDTTYTLTEQPSAGWTPENPSGLTGTIQASTTAAASVTNRYEATGSFPVSATKIVTGIEMEDGAFSFILTDDDDEFVARATNDGEGHVTFAAINIDPAWAGTTKQFHLAEERGDIAGVQYDTHTEDISVAFADDGAGTLSADVTYDDGTCEFHNSRSLFMPITGMTGLDDNQLLNALAAIAIASMAILCAKRKQHIDEIRRKVINDSNNFKAIPRLVLPRRETGVKHKGWHE